MEKQTVSTEPFEGQKPGTSGLRKKVAEFQKPNYIANFVQSIFNSLECSSFKDGTLLISGDGRYYNREAIQIACNIAAGNGVRRVWVGVNGWMSTPAASAVIREREAGVAFGGILLTASHNPGGPKNDFGIKYNISNGGPAPETVTSKIYEETTRIKSYIKYELPELNLSKAGSTEYCLAEGKKFVVEIIDPVEDWLKVMKSIFDFELLKTIVKNPKFSFVYDGMHGIAGPYAKKVFLEELGADAKSLIHCDPLEDFGGGHPDPNLTYAHELVERMNVNDPAKAKSDSNTPEFGAAGDGDNDRNMILGRGWFVTPSDSVAIIAHYAEKCIPYFQKNKVKGVSRSMPTSCALDRVAEQHGVKCYEVPTGWKFFGNLMDGGLVNICGEESFGTGSDHIREKDGLWAVLSWMSILAYRNKEAASSDFVSVQKVNEEFWNEFGRNYYTRYDYEEVSAEQGKQVMDHCESSIKVEGGDAASLSATTKEFLTKNKLKIVDQFSYTDPVDHCVTANQGVRVIFEDGSRIIVRLSGTGSVGATVRLYLEKYEKKETNLRTEDAMKQLVTVAMDLTQIQRIIGRDAPTVIT